MRRCRWLSAGAWVCNAFHVTRRFSSGARVRATPWLAPDAAAVVAAFAARQPLVSRVHAPIQPTPLVTMPALATMLGLHGGGLLVKDEGHRMGLQAFKGLGVSFAVHQLLARLGRSQDGTVLCTMTDGNHGRAVAHVARKHNCSAVIFVPQSMVPARRAAIEAEGARVVVVPGSYDDAIAQMREEAAAHGWHIVSDTAWEGYEDVPADIVAGYGTMFREVEEQWRTGKAHGPITHVVLQAGVGSFASAGAAWLEMRRSERQGDDDLQVWAPGVKLVVVEPTDADCVMENARVGTTVSANLVPCTGQTESIMAGLNCGMPSTMAWPVLRDTATVFCSVGDEWARQAMRRMRDEGVVAGESGAAGVAALLALQQGAADIVHGRQGSTINLTPDSTVLVINTEADTDPEAYAAIVEVDSE